MIHGLKVGVLVPAYNEESLIAETLASIPADVERVLVVDDGSTDGTAAILSKLASGRVRVICHVKNRGLGQALATGYREALSEKGIDVWVVMAGDGQMDPADLPALIEPIAQKRAMYVKGNRLFFPGVWRVMPRHRFMGNAALTLLTKFATGYFQLLDPQCGYTAIHRDAIPCFDLDKPHQGYGYNASLLAQLNIYDVPVVDAPVRPVYGRAVSKIRLHRYVPSVSWLLLRLFLRRIIRKYIVMDFHPVGLAYLTLFLTMPISLWSGFAVAQERFKQWETPLPVSVVPSLLLWVTFSLASLIIFLFAMWMDIEYTRARQRWIHFPENGP